MLERCFSGETVVNSIIQKANARLKFLFRKQKFLNLHCKKLLIMSLIQYHFDYACSLWYPGLSKLLWNRLQITQNKIIIFVLKLDPRTYIGSDEFKTLGWLPVSKRVDQIILNHIFRIKSGTLPDFMKEHFILLHLCIDLEKTVVFVFLKWRVSVENRLLLQVVPYGMGFHQILKT